MIRDLKEEDLQAAPKSEIAALVRQYSDWNVSQIDVARAVEEVDRIRKLSPAVRAVVASYLRSDELFCHECGQTSCIHGYPDD